MGQPKPMVLIILDGWGHRDQKENNAIRTAHTPTWDRLWEHYPHTLIKGSGTHVGLPDQQMGNSEVGHMNIGAGRIVYQDFTRIQKNIENGEFFKNPILAHSIQSAVQRNKAIHIMGLLSPGGVHSHEQHIQAILELTSQHNAQEVYLHAFLDGRDTPPKSAATSLSALHDLCQTLGVGRIASITGRYYAMDRDKRWDRTAKAYDLLTTGIAPFHADSAEQALEMAYARGETDEFVQPTTIHDSAVSPHTLHDGDVVLFMNFRADRVRQLSYALVSPQFNSFERKFQPKLSHFVSLTRYAEDLAAQVAYPPTQLTNVLGDYLAQHDLKQLRIAETEKYAHVTFFLNGGREEPFPDEERILVASPKVTTYDQQPEMSAIEITNHLITQIQNKTHDVIVCNFANADMVGHTGNFSATIKAIETIDACLKRILNALNEVNGEALITADHGNAEHMYCFDSKQPHTAHTNEPVPLVYIGRDAKVHHPDGNLADIAPTLLALMRLDPPPEMTGTPLFIVEN